MVEKWLEVHGPVLDHLIAEALKSGAMLKEKRSAIEADGRIIDTPAVLGRPQLPGKPLQAPW